MEGLSLYLDEHLVLSTLKRQVWALAMLYQRPLSSHNLGNIIVQGVALPVPGVATAQIFWGCCACALSKSEGADVACATKFACVGVAKGWV